MKLTPLILLEIGFVELNPEPYRNKFRVFEFFPPKTLSIYNGYFFRVHIGNYPETNPNSGIISLVTPEIKEHIRGESVTMRGEQEIAIATHVTTLEQLNAIYTALTQNEPFVYNPAPALPPYGSGSLHNP